MPEEEPLRAPIIGDIHLLVDDLGWRRQVQALLEPPRGGPLRSPIRALTVTDLYLLVEDLERRCYVQALFCPGRERAEEKC